MLTWTPRRATMDLKKMMKILLPLVIWLTELITWIHCKGGPGYGIKREIFFLNIEDGYFGCQVNQSTDVLQLYELSRLCDGHQDCYQGSDELARELKCTSNCTSETTGLTCQNGACLDSQCHCNDGYGGCSCEVPDENECKYRPCDVFAHCTNTLGSFHCSCFPGYAGDGFHCQDVNECEDPSIASRCVQNAECCNLPAHFLCKCKPGYAGDGEIECRDINECLQSNICGSNSVCRNTPGNYTCECKEGYRGNPVYGCNDVDECATNLCAPGALCTNFAGGFHCECPPGTTGNAYKGGCQDVNECALNPCGVNALCKNTPGSFQCICSPGYIGDPFHQCTGGEPLSGTSCDHCPAETPCDPITGVCAEVKVPCLSDVECANNQICVQGSCQLSCSTHNPCAQNAVCINTVHGTECSCIEGFQGNGFVGCIPVLPTYQLVCQYNEDCPPDKLCDRLNRRCINPCYGEPCGENAECVPKNHAADCRCPPGSYGNPHLSCTAVTGCHQDEECNANEACVQGKCGNPCHCGPNAICDVLFHRASCKCLPGYTGNPNQGCQRPKNPCDPNPCGMHAFCELDNGNPICYCPKGMTGNPFKQCIPEGDDCHPNPCGANSDCRVVHGSAVCFCLPEFEGEPPITPCRLPKNPCHPSPCGPNTQCSLLDDGFAKCTCLSGYVESPNTIRGCVEKRNPCDPNPCGYGAICDPNRTPCCFCPENTVGNPYKYCGEPIRTLCQPGPCGPNADCYITGNTEQCFCKSGFQGDPYTGCQLLPANPCYPSPCGPLSTCTVSRDGHPTCACPPGILLDSNGGCTGFECTIDEDCPFNKACVRYRCQDPCPGSCGIGASCRVEKHHPICTCNHGLTGNPLIRCAPIESYPVHNPCMPYPCGPNTYCKISGNRAVCTCDENFGGDPKKGCKPECTLNTDCASDQVCINYKCKNPCSINNVCGLGAVCVCRDHMPTCICREGFTGNPFLQCLPKPEYPFYSNTTLPCTPNPCDPSTQCQVYPGDVAMCDPCYGPTGHYNPSCIPECLCNADCPFNLACLSQKCLDPCSGSCGIHAYCTVVYHAPVCSCPEGLTGNPFEHCSPVTDLQPVDLCHQGKCGANALCKNTQGHITCECPRGYYGNPYLVCHPECVINTDCPQTRACLNNKCVDPCHGVCGVNANCQVINHQPICFCPQEYTGNALVNCYPNREYLPPTPMGQHGNPCDPSPCGPNSRCLISPQGYATCSCVPGYRGSPPLCKPECVVSTECSLMMTCINQKCVNPCHGTCGVGSNCYVLNHNPICNCPAGHVGDPFVMCILPPVESYPNTPNNPCEPTPCGPNSICQVREGHPVCSCLANFLGSPPYCRPECIMNSECPFDKACTNEKCRNPCTQSCGLNAKCDVVNHTPYCTCLSGYEGDAFISCSKKPATVPPLVPTDPCNPSPCGENAQCSVHDGALRCTCIPPYIGNPYNGACRPECVISSDCPPNAACLSSHCRDPCPGVCGINAECTVVNHVPSCTCFPDHIGDPFQSCRRKPITPPVPINPCDPSPCGPNSICHVSHGQAVCSCKINFVGQSPNCRPECVVSAECNSYLACIAHKCSDPCPGTCGLHARCTVINHNPICSCPPNTVGDPFTRCIPEAPREPPIAYNPCEPSPCGVNSECKVIDNRPLCSCLAGMLGTPPYCRPECLIHADCPSKLACLSNKCRDPCIGSCGLNAHCTVINHQPVCACIEGYHGDPFSSCSQVPVVLPTHAPNPCVPSPCGPNSVCKESQGAGSCSCQAGYFGDPYLGCRPECVQNSDCYWDKACVNYKCVDPCSGACGLNAECRVVHHSPNCFCVEGYTGNPLSACRKIPAITCTTCSVDLMVTHPCMRSPCGPYSQCRNVNNQAVCSCLPGYFGRPPNCHPECISNSDCFLDKSCINQICSNPCTGLCGYNARCHVVNHNPICSCNSGYTGDPFVRCVKHREPDGYPSRYPVNPCIPSPCGPNSVCKIHGENIPSCSCLTNYIGSPPNCRPECTINAECEGHLACQNDRCIDPCPGSCGLYAICAVVHHTPVCTCENGYTGDPFSVCSPQIEPPRPTERPDPCHPSPCGANAVCKERNGAGSCTCLPEYVGDPYTGCRPECVLNTECPQNTACVNNKCVNPCVGVCGPNAECRVINHAPSCSCITGYVGNPLVVCQPAPKPEPKPERHPCLPSPCGPYSECRPIDNHAVCSCQKGYIGSPPACRPECMVSSECPQDKACINQKCSDPCPGVCGINARCHVVSHNPICSCSPGFTGDPFIRCIPERPAVPEERPNKNPCISSPCGPNSQCRNVGGNAACSCLENYIGRPPNCRPECVISAECPPTLACQNERCRDPCIGACGIHTTCLTQTHVPLCYCESGHTGDPFSGCYPIPQALPEEHPEPCNPSPCGANAICKERNGAGSCICLPEYFGDPYTGCRPECVTNSDCDPTRACLNNKCRDPCPGTCGLYAECRVVNHAPSCFCLVGYVGNPITACHPVAAKPPHQATNPCIPSPCGPYSECRRVDDHAVCSCQKEYIGTPPACRPECMVSSECALNKACINKKCADPCPGTCGPEARCQVVNHNPICSCSPGFTGDPFVRCIKEPPQSVPEKPINPCIPAPCGPNSECRIIGNTPACSCRQNYVGRPPNCRPECTINAECPSNMACQNERCRDPCPGSCGLYAVCAVHSHTPQCTCESGFTGDPFVGCSKAPLPSVTEGPLNPCNPSPCGANAVCKERIGAGACVCLPEYFGDPYTGCRPECVANADCDASKACANNKCKNPCPGTCGLNALCTVIKHTPSCSCLPGYTGDAITACHQIPEIEPEKQNPCLPSPCGPYSECRQVNNHAVCSCQKGYVGTPPACRPECMVSSECAQNKACLNQKCADPCPGTCGLNAHCQVVNHNPICSCSTGYSGDPFVRCVPEQQTTTALTPSGNPCVPSPCGLYSECRMVGGTPACSCLQEYIGRPPNCRPECTINAECQGNLACQNGKCRDPCRGSCGVHTNCATVNHVPQCTCESGYTGDPFAGCVVQQIATTERPRNPCNPSPCGANAICKERNGAGSCICLPEYFGDPYTGCRPECVTNDDCERAKTCLNNKCRDPCPGTCGIHAECRVLNHAPSCYCLPGYTGDPLSVCTLIPSTTRAPINPCNPSPCGPNSICREVNRHAVCSCKTGFIGSPPSCKPECLISSECALDKACVNQKCVDPCPSTCGENARCQVVTHNPICSCSPGFTGDPFSRCTKVESTTYAAPVNLCEPSPCGPYSICRIINNTPACSCHTNYIGQPPNCRPQCVLHADCPSNLACKNERCVDPCPGSCGQGANCYVINHNSVCACSPGYTGDALIVCHPEPTTLRQPVISDPCFPSPCGPNTECINKNEVAACRCLAGYFGDPYSGCKHECESNSDCGLPLACIGYKCVDACPGTCGAEAICTTVNHIPICSCPPEYTGDPFFSCRPMPLTPKPPTNDPCYPSPCGPNSQCRQVNEQAVCSCLTNYVGSPPNCRPECVVSSECPLDKACINQKCADPCLNTCGLHAICNVRNHNPFCSCPPQFTGDPFSQCIPIPVSPLPATTEAPATCVPSPCGPNSQCKIVSNSPVCSCLPDFIGSPPSCRPECVISSECPSQFACINQHCRDPCPGSCGVNANCHVLNHVPICICNEGHTGDPFSLCSLTPITTPATVNPCHPSPCGPNAFCHGEGICECLPEYTGNPYEICRPECVISGECPRDKACIRYKCQNPCTGTCGQNANCDVINHIPVCSCPPEMTGDPFLLCRPKPADVPRPSEPCAPSPCGPNSICHNNNGQAVCSCLPEYQGSPPSCRPECIVSEECPTVQTCINKKCVNPCVGVCGYGARCEVIHHSPICSCQEKQTGDPFKSCYDIPALPEPPHPFINPCVPSPCGPNSLCQSVNDQPSCSCLQGFVTSPPNCRPECVVNSDCPRNLACINNKCKDPCPGSCGLNSQCQVISNTVSCSCQPGYTGNPFEQCVLRPEEEPINPCEPSPCGTNAVCKQQNGAGSCTCIPDYQGNPYEGCRPECVLSADCPSNKACVRSKCHDPCPGICGQYATCTVINHIPNCYCVSGYVGDPFSGCHQQLAVEVPPLVLNPCVPSPCGPNSKCVERNGQAVCSCLPDYQGSPPDCRPECVVNAECPTNRACHKYKCNDPCPGTCGINARCEVIHHQPICSCPSGYTGDPFHHCYLAITEPLPPSPPPNPCVPSPCGPYSECRLIGSQPSCSCHESYIGLPPNCRPECVVNTDCAPTLACISEKCRDPCPGSCGLNAHCQIHNHIPTCTCIPQYTGDPFTQCSQILILYEPPPKLDPCHPSPCGANALCNNGQCFCISNYFGDPYTGCRPECTMNSDCSRNKACINQHCLDPCPGVCGQDARCDVVNHIPTCSCPHQTTGDAFVACRPIVHVDVDPCNPSPCGPNSICRVNDGHAVCSCQPGLIGMPPSCRPECIVSAECDLTLACLNSKCQDPCPGTCGLYAKCNVVNHNPICSCPSGYNGDPFRQCHIVTALPPEQPKPINPCIPSPCGPNAVCQIHGDTPACSCLQNYIGSPPNCRPECTINPECPTNMACINQRCVDPCTGSCGFNAVCSVINHLASCTCIQGYNGDPFSSCIETSAHLPPPSHPVDPCFPSPCGPNARCHSEISVAVCQCLPEYQGNPYEGCRPECLISSDCIMSKACIRNKCQDPCPGTCGLSAICSVSNHIPICFCPEGTTGDAFRACEPIPREPVSVVPCSPSSCGPNTECHVVNNVAICECISGFEGSPSTSGCHPECVINADCPRNKACVNNKCINPCPGVCGYKAVCQTLNHSPVCSCSPPLVGDPFVECEESPVVPIDPCNPSPCEQNGHCRLIGGVASCTYPECVINQDCPRDKACYNQRCKDSCVGACGLNALCQVVNHGAVCSCPPGYFGEPKLQCKQETAIDILHPECTTNQDCPNNRACLNQACRDPCREMSNVCAANADCRVQQHRPYCFCRVGFTGHAHSYCNEVGCRIDTDCEPTEACVNTQCIDPCSYTQCGQNALCLVDYNNHKSRCYCPETYFGNPLVSCEHPQCLSDLDCPLDLACVNQMCQSPCTCAPNAICTVQSHVPHCRCPPGHTGNPYEHCIIAPFELPVECKQDADCSSKLACFNGTCRNPCIETKPCGANAECSIVDTLPLRTMTCLCLPGYVGDADSSCRKEQAPIVPGCQGNNECPFTDICVNRKCADPCAVHNPCAPNANCQSANHKATCKCPAGLIGDPFANCYQVPHDLPECVNDSDCPSTRSCINEKCQEPCAIANPCGIFAECSTLQHRPICNCPDGWAGNPEKHCYKPECKSDSDCLYDKACRNNNCISPCAVMSCGIGARCMVQGHAPHCVCPPGTQGNPLLSCVSVGCQYNEDCADHETCDRLNRKCRPVCDVDTCAERATCTPKHHQPLCSCLPGTHGNPYSQCSDSRTPSPECVKDSECPSQHACINSRCENPCRQTGICVPDQECRVQDTYPVRTVMCTCPADNVATSDGHCQAIVPLECKLDADCHESSRCVYGNCIEACRIDPCGLNALCLAQNHRSTCLCPPHYIGNPHVECTNAPVVPMPPTIPECTRDDDCLLNLGCHNQKCVSPCLLENSCGRGSFCHAHDHKPICRCPEGYQGDPLVECRPPPDTQLVGCISNSECALDESCINRRCMSPCNCGLYAECRVVEHYPLCYCQPGYSGNPQTGCVKEGCESDEQCAFDKTCYNGNCISPCIVGDPCAVSAECYGDNHRAACKCPPTFQGDPFVKCEQVECQIDADCPQDRMCITERCVNPCDDTYNFPCAPNAICYVRNHATGCRCPDYLPIGNPLSYCKRRPQPDVPEPVCKIDADCPVQHACLKENCVNPCTSLAPCSPTARCNVLDSVPLRTLTCTCAEGWVLNKEDECKPIALPSPSGCESSTGCPTNETCINRQCRNPCNCGLNTECFVQNHRPICSCKSGYEGNPNAACKLIGCRRDSECDSGRACINGDCVNPCIVKNPCGANAECFARGNTAQCRCVSGYRGNPYERCYVVGCRSNNDCPEDRSCINAQCINPCVYDNPCATDAHCRVRNHLALCICPPGTSGNPYTFCQEERRPECREDGDCEPQLACLNNKCRNPCSALEPCYKPSTCEVVNTLPVRTMVCVCPSGYISDGSATCKVIPAVTSVACTSDSQCPSDRACVNGVCVNPCNCGPHAECHVKNNKPICVCVPGYDGNPNIECVAAGCRGDSDCRGQDVCHNRVCAAACAADGSSCGTDAVCYGIHHRAVCECPPGLVGNPQIACSLAGCKMDSECPIDRSCVNRKCVNPCAQSRDCAEPAVCVPFNHKADCSCPPGYFGNPVNGCEPVKSGCRSDSECPSKQACINEECINPCTAAEPCGKDALCTVFDTTPVKTMICECPPGYEGNAVVACAPISQCAIEKGYVKDEHGNCVCPPGTALNHDDECRRCVPELGYKIDESGHCVCALERGLVIDERGQCVCPPEHGYQLDYFGNCVPAPPPGCESDNDCPDNLSCVNRKCINPCENKPCGEGASCNVTGHKAVCVCPPNTSGNPEIVCKTFIRKEFTQPEMVVSCLSDGVQVRMVITESGFNGILYVKGHSKEEECRKLISVPDDTPTRVEIFKVLFGACGLIHINGQASFVLVIQKHPKLVTYKAQAYHIKCVYATSEQNITIGFNVSMLTTAGTIANTGPPPRCVMKIVTQTGQEINSAEIGENLMLQVDVEPTSIYGGFARSCVAKTLDNNVENEYIVTDENGCATEPGIFGEWQHSPDSQSLTAEFNAFKFPTSDNIRFQCNIRVCFGRCQPVNCRGYDAFGKRRKREIWNSTGDVDILHGGQLREEITIESNAIFTIERREERLVNPTEEPQTTERDDDDICISIIGLIVALILTALLAVVAVAVSVSCWLMASRRRSSAAASGPLYHPSGVPNPIFSQSNH